MAYLDRSPNNLLLAFCRDHKIKPNGKIPPLEAVLHGLQAQGMSRDNALQRMIDAVTCGWLEFGPEAGQLLLTRAGYTASRVETGHAERNPRPAR
jgi:hypothetical protein